jgi:hypothetical protein
MSVNQDDQAEASERFGFSCSCDAGDLTTLAAIGTKVIWLNDSRHLTGC